MTDTVEGFRLLPQQERVWALQEQDGAGSYRTRGAIRLEGETDVTRVRRALERLAARHEILRTTFRRLPGMEMPLQVVGAVPPAVLPGQAGGGPFDLARGPVWSAELRAAGPNAARLLLDFPALCADRASLARIAVELAALLEGGAPASDPGEPLQPADVAEWIHELREKPESSPGLDAWRKLDLSAAASQSLPFERGAPAGAGFEIARAPVPLTAGIVDAVEDLCRGLGCSPAAFFLACWQGLIARHLGEPPALIGYLSDGRRAEELATALGPYSRYLPLAPAGGEATVRAAVLRVAETVASQERRGDLFAWGASVRSADGGVPYFPFCFDWADRTSVRAGSLVLRLEEERSAIDRFRVRLSCVRSQEGLAAELEYDSRRVAKDDAERLASRLVRMLQSAVSDPDSPLAKLEVLPEPERLQQFVEWNDTGRDFADARPVLERFEAAAAKSPGSPAVVCGDRSLTHAELNAKANRIAHELRSAGVGPNVLVALCVERSLEMIVGLLAIWKAGGAYVPLDPSLPAERLAFLLEDTGAPFVLTRRAFQDRFADAAARVFLFEEEGIGPAADPERTAGPADLAYVIFTAGSRGRPKGVAVEHRQVSNYLAGILKRLEAPEGSTFATVTTLAADLGNTSIFPALATGGCLRVVPEESSADPEGLAEEFARSPVDYLKIVPSHLTALLSASRPERILPKRCLVLGGEASTWELVDRVRGLAPDCRILNHYGPTEATIGVTTFSVDGGPGEPRTRTVPIGRPLPNCRIYLLDEAGRTPPPGVAAELHVAGAGLARGYLNRPELTAERFVEVDLGPRRERLYRTGDLARYLPNGDIELLGRTDDQFKLHGFRIEPGEIEAALRLHPAVRDARVLPRDIGGAGRRLIAYFVPRSGEAPDSPELRRYLAGKLPEYMVPAAFVRMPRFPLTANGKIDRAALPLPDLARPDGADPMVPPRTGAETTLWRVWADVLRMDRFGVDDNFFELGGDSILAIQIISRAAREGLRLTPRQLFEHQTVAELARVAGTSTGVARDQGPVTGPVPLTPIQRWFFEQEFVDPHHFNQSVLLEGREALDPAILEEAVERLVVHHDALRLRFRQTSGKEGWSQSGAAPERSGAFSVVRLPGRTEDGDAAAMAAAAATAQASLDLSEGPLLRALYFDRGPEKPGRLLLAIHHLAVDTVSWRILLEDLEGVYRRIRAGETPALPPKTTSFREWAEKIGDLARSGALDSETAFWLAQNEEAADAVPSDSEGENTLGSARSVASELSEDETRALTSELPAVYRTQINDALLAALADAFRRSARVHRLRIDLEGHGREEIVPGIDLSRTVGWFTSRFPLVLELPESEDLGDRLLAVKERLRAVPGRGVGYGALRYLAGGPVASAARGRPEPSVSFNYLGQLDPVESGAALMRVLPSVGPTRSPRARRPHPISVEGKILEGRLRFTWIYSENLHRRETIERLAAAFEESLRGLIARARSVGSGRYTPSDFPNARMSEKDLDKLVSSIKTAEPGVRR